MSNRNQYRNLLLVTAAATVLSACGGANDVATPGAGSVVINNPPATPTPTPTPPSTPATVTAASSCPAIPGVTDQNIISGPTGTWRVCRLPNLISATTTLPKVPGLVYLIDGRVDVGCDAGPTPGASYVTTTPGCSSATLTADQNVTLNIDPGVILVATPGASWIAVNRGNKINAQGSATQPIIFTSRDNITAPASFSETSNQLWGGVVLLGRGVVTGPCNIASPCQRQTEGASAPALYGGTDNSYNAGTIRYAQFRYSGYPLAPDNELQSLTTGGIGSNTILDHIQTHNSSDDGAEFFGGAVNMKHYIATGADDDSLDVDNGAQMNLQYAMLLQRPGFGDALMEIDSNGLETDTPRTVLKVANFIGRQPLTSSNNESNAQAALFFRGNSDTTLLNGIVIAPNNECVRLHGTNSTAVRATLTARSVVMQCNATKYIATGTSGVAYTVADIAAIFTGNNNNDAFTPTLTNVYFNGSAENAVTPTDPTTFSSWFTATPTPYRIGAAWTENSTWYQGWTCNSDIATFWGTSSQNLCTSVPTT